MAYAGVSKITLINLLPAINGNNGFGSGSASTTHTKYASSTLMLTATTSNAEVTAATTTSFPLISTHKYYVRVEIFQEKVVGGAGIYWPIAEPTCFGGRPGVANQWTIVGEVVSRSSFTDGNYQFRLDFDNNKVAGTMWFDGMMLIDLTAAFGAGNEPNTAWCHANIPYFSGSMEYENPTGLAREIKSMYTGDLNNLARTIKKVYVGDPSGIARLSYEIKMTTLGELPVGTSVFMNVDGIRTEFLVIHHGNPDTSIYDTSCNGTWLIMKDVYTTMSIGGNQYNNSTVDKYLSNTFINLLDSNVSSSIKEVKIPYTKGYYSNTVYTKDSGMLRKIFILSVNEIVSGGGDLKDGTQLSYFTNHDVRAYMYGAATKYYTRTAGKSHYYNLYYITADGWYTGFYADGDTTKHGVRPAMIFPSDTVKVDPSFNIVV